jgi:hypothetical protein
MLCVSLAGSPDFVQQECAGRVNGTVQIVAQAAIFFSCGADKRAEFRFEQRLLTFARAQNHD